MFDNVGSKIKSLSGILCKVGIILSIVISIVMFYMADEYYRVEEVYYTLACVFLVFGPISSWIGSLLLYGFGEIVEKTCEIDRNICNDNKKSVVQMKTDSERMAKLEKLRAQELITEDEYLQAINKESV